MVVTVNYNEKKTGISIDNVHYAINKQIMISRFCDKKNVYVFKVNITKL